MRREPAALRLERVRLVMAREIVTEQRAIVNKTAAPAGSFSMFRICKVLSFA
jgi:hypothetical protein